MALTQNYKFAKFGSKTEMSFNFYKVWHSKQIEHANYEHITRQCLERLRNYCLRIIIDSEWL